MRVVGFKLNKGEFNGNPYSNYYIYYEYTNDKVKGIACGYAKVKVQVMDNICAILGIISPDDLIGTEFERFNYDMYKNVVGIQESI